MYERPALLSLRRRIARSSQPAQPDDSIALETPALDAALPGGLLRGAVHEILCPDPADASALGFLAFAAGRFLARDPGLLLWAGVGIDFFPPGFAAYGCPAHRLLLANCRTAAETLWTFEEGLRTPGLAAVAGHASPPAFSESRRLQLAARRNSRPLLLLVPHREPLPPSAATTRWTVSSRPSQGNAPRWRLQLLRQRGGRPGSWMLDFESESQALRIAGPSAADATAMRRKQA